MKDDKYTEYEDGELTITDIFCGIAGAVIILVLLGFAGGIEQDLIGWLR